MRFYNGLNINDIDATNSYIFNSHEKISTTIDELRSQFISLDEYERNAKYENNFETYLSSLGYTALQIMSPSEYAAILGVRETIKDDISIAQFDEIIADDYGAWNYPLDEFDEASGSTDGWLVVVKFITDSDERIVEIF